MLLSSALRTLHAYFRRHEMHEHRVAHSLPLQPQSQRRPSALAQLALQVCWARHLEQLRAAQRLRYQVFADEMGARLNSALAGHDIDRYDDFCEHLLVMDAQQQRVIGTYRVLTPAQARRAGSIYSDNEFDLTPLCALRPRMVELGRSCVHPDYRQGAVIMALWGALAEFMTRNQLDIMIGCASIPLQPPGAAAGRGGHLAAAIWQQLRQRHLAPAALQVQPRLALPVAELLRSLPAGLSVEPPALIQGYLRLGTRILGAPAWDPDFNTADLPMLMRLDELAPRYRRHFIKPAF
jgi:putative hemolysin